MTRRDLLSILYAISAAVLAWCALTAGQMIYRDHVLLEKVVQALSQPPPQQSSKEKP